MTACESDDAPASVQVSDGYLQLANFRDLGGLRLAGGGVTQVTVHRMPLMRQAATAPCLSALVRRLQGQGRRLPVDVDPDSELLGAPADAIDLVVDRRTGWPGGPLAWVTEHRESAGDLSRWRDRMAAGGSAS